MAYDRKKAVGSKKRTKDKRKSDLKVPSDAPTVLIAPKDYRHIYSAKKAAIRPNPTIRPQLKVQSLPSDALTAMIAPEDYQHIYSSKNPKVKQVTFQSPEFIGKKKPKTHLMIRSDDPTILIAPEDYEHIFSKRKQLLQIEKQKQKVQPQKLILKMQSEGPTALIAPEDYAHIYSATKKVIKEYDMKIDSSIPTAMIVPEDYERIYKKPAIQSPKRAKIFHQSKLPNIVQISPDEPTVLIEPDDYEYIYSKTKKQSKPLISEEYRKFDLNDPNNLLHLIQIIQKLQTPKNVNRHRTKYQIPKKILQEQEYIDDDDDDDYNDDYDDYYVEDSYSTSKLTGRSSPPNFNTRSHKKYKQKKR